jgi:2-polyprenyl-3-methyl-5-hydroxy-6-metoxy-1,4-benzoquinol methylase
MPKPPKRRLLSAINARLPKQLRALTASLRPYRPYEAPSESSYGAVDPWGLRSLDAVPQRAVIAGYLRHLVPGGRVLDIGCGEGLIVPHLAGLSYVGVDLSAEAIGRAKADFGAVAQFHAADALTYNPEGLFDAVVFNECLYYLDDPAAAVARYEAVLKPGGFVIVSMYEAPTTARTWKAIGAGRTARDAVYVRHANGIGWDIRLY